MLRSTITCLLSLHVCKIDGQVWGFELHGDACSTVSVRLRTTLASSKGGVELERCAKDMLPTLTRFSATFNNSVKQVKDCQRSYLDENTSTHLTIEVKHRRAGAVLGWVTAWELPVALTFCCHISFKFCTKHIEPTSFNETCGSFEI